MGFDFPAAPIEGQTFTPLAGAPEYIWRNPTWQLVSATAPVGMVISDAPPPEPVPGQQWWESDTGLLFVWYNDGNSSQWVQVNGAGLTDAPMTGEQYARRDATWEIVAGAGGVEEAPNDGNIYARQNEAWTEIPVGEAPIDGQEYVRKDGAWVVSSGGGGGTVTIINSGSFF